MSTQTPALAGGIDSARLRDLKSSNNANYKSIARAILEAIEYSTVRPIQRSKLPGQFRYYLEASGAAVDVNDQKIALASKVDGNGDRFCPDGYESLSVKAGIGLPYGFALETGTSFVLGDHRFGTFYGNIGFQAFDFDRIVVTDMVPSIAFSTSFNYAYSGQKAMNFGGAALLGAYHRYWLAQVNYILQLTYGMLMKPSYNRVMIRHGISSDWPLFEGLHLSTEIYYKPIQVGVSLGYLF